MTHQSYCDYGVTYGGGRRGQCTCGAVAEQLTAGQAIRLAALDAAVRLHAPLVASGGVMTADVTALARRFEDYIRGDQQ